MNKERTIMLNRATGKQSEVDLTAMQTLSFLFDYIQGEDGIWRHFTQIDTK